jgi:hypothetical protein
MNHVKAIEKKYLRHLRHMSFFTCTYDAREMPFITLQQVHRIQHLHHHSDK